MLVADLSTAQYQPADIQRLAQSSSYTNRIPEANGWPLAARDSLVGVSRTSSEAPVFELHAAFAEFRKYSQSVVNASTVAGSIITALRFLASDEGDILSKGKPPHSFSFNDEGELMLEWYGRKGARFSTVFAKDGYLYYALIFHGDYSSGKAFLRESWPLEVELALHRLEKDAV